MTRTLKHDIKEAIDLYRALESHEVDVLKKYPLKSDIGIECIKSAEYNRGRADALEGILELLEQYIG